MRLAPPTLARPPRLAARHDLHLLAGAVFLSAMGDLLAMIALALTVHDLTGSPFAVAALFATTMVPVVVLAPLAGLIVDRVESVRVLVLASVAQGVVALALAFTSDLAAILVLSCLLSSAATISQPAEFALVPAAAGRRELTSANGLMEAARYAGFAAGPALAGALAASGGTRLALIVNAGTFAAIAVAGVLMRARRPPPSAAAAREGATGPEPADRARDGAVHLLRDPVLRVVVVSATAALLVISASLTAEVFYVQDVLHAGDTGYAVTMAAWMIGMVGGAMGVARRVPAAALATGALVALTVQGLGMGAQTLIPTLGVAAAGFTVGGIGHGVKNTLIRTLIQQRCPEHLHGRAFAAYNAARNAAELGALGAGGLIVTALGPQLALLIAGLGPVVAGVAGLALLRRRRIGRPASAPPSPAGVATEPPYPPPGS